MLLRYCLSDFEMAPFAHIINGITFAFIIIIIIVVVVVVVVVDLLTRVSYAEMAEWTRGQ
jgi:Na+/citrate or Na+/malate symporter